MRVQAKDIAIALILMFASYSGHTLSADTSDASSKFEIGLALSGIQLPGTSTFGIGGRAVFNVNPAMSLEGEGNFFFNDAVPNIQSGGHAAEGLFGAKLGYRSDKVGVFGKVRPGLISFSNAIQNATFSLSTPPFLSIQTGRRTRPALDLGAVIEFYPAKHWAWRSDLGDTMIFYDSTNFLGIRIPGEKRNTFQFGTGLEYRF
jgi:hypothetical protein